MRLVLDRLQLCPPSDSSLSPPPTRACTNQLRTHLVSSSQEEDGETFRPATSTRRWAESVLDQTRTGLTMNLSASKGVNAFALPPPPPSSVASSSAFPSSIGSVSVSGSSKSGYSGSEDSFAFNHAYHSRASSLIRTSISGGSVLSKSFQSPSLSQPHAANLNLGASPDVDAEAREQKSESLPVLPGFTFGRTESEHQDHTRTFSAPAAAKLASSVDAVLKSYGLGPLRQGLGGYWYWVIDPHECVDALVSWGGP